jgi:hypothetical protein
MRYIYIEIMISFYLRNLISNEKKNMFIFRKRIIRVKFF